MTGGRIRWVALVAAVSLLGLLPTAGSAAAVDPGPRPMDVAISFDTLPSGLGLELDGVRTPTPYSFVCGQGTGHTLTATSPLSDGRTRHSFRNWTDGLTSPSRTFVCDAAQNFTAVYGTEHAIEVDTHPSGLDVVVDGTISTSPVYLWCAAGTTVDLLAFGFVNGTGARYFFGNWSDRGAQGHAIPCDGPATYIAFYRTQYLISVFTQPEGLEVSIDGETLRSPALLWCDEFTTHALNAATDQPVGATQFRFVRWDDGESASTRTVQCGGSMNYTATFAIVTAPTPAVGVAWTFVLLLLLAILIPVIVAGIALASRRSPPPVQILVSPPHGVSTTAARPSVVPRTCRQCGRAAESDWMFCMGCGAELPRAFPPTPPRPPETHGP